MQNGTEISENLSILRQEKVEVEEQATELLQPFNVLAYKRTETKIERLRLENEDIKQNRDLRKSFANKIFWFVVAYMIVAMVFVLSSGIECLCFSLSDTVIVALITTTTANMIGLLMIVLKYLFPQK